MLLPKAKGESTMDKRKTAWIKCSNMPKLELDSSRYSYQLPGCLGLTEGTQEAAVSLQNSS
jgi:hypothetical protein